MNITINGELLNVDRKALVEVLQSFGAVAPFAVAVNSEFIPQSQHGNYVLNEGDSVELLSPIQGG
ncbi:sulfur carrier protein ThiS [Pseudoalteromonas carrageenovora]|uniref:Sulfur carrier protein n=1 Tax=Pseudoalteromonas carrageenovora IAM 12662 TaxID=1314868 RepID=A0A2K4X659_PSEVC|nr:sulfur carrier protein ThiS [Pseudoalteromonas carrageenovora]MBE0382011.1 sulfur carrier protein [Pseudoalteromonas carrageenovora IAM 12662]MCQ8889404.1 sulfur carrier protein ThiS [Pseudoalteromonas carrageenovora]MDO6466228.1 sulfur carrier protein ThiS [Pseudoalteromonas carrageenovora]MDO6548943.1 sulfur carrier protein ThiS [Pseudoalteromonas carrageenovora]MDO6833505.1 sulfur carrier protein ThiS [Pseudoalteromonas carrageenovora]|tara:strand:- start:33 stop:227 length:195 start_codon:yes stop_codon:yes gene_type:complete